MIALSDYEREVVEEALSIISSKFAGGPVFDSPEDVQEYLRLHYALRHEEVFSVLWLNNKSRLIAHEEIATGTVDGAVVHPRRVIKSGLQHNAVRVIFCHNHPSGSVEPSEADRALTKHLAEVLRHIDILVIDHIVVGDGFCSFSRRGWI